MKRANYEEMIAAAVAIASYPPKRGHLHRFAAYVPWTRIYRLRAALDVCGIDWRESRHGTGPTP